MRRFLKHQVRGKPSSAASQTEENPIEENMPITDAVIDKMINRAADLGKQFWVKVEERERAKKQEQPQGDLLVYAKPQLAFFICYLKCCVLCAIP